MVLEDLRRRIEERLGKVVKRRSNYPQMEGDFTLLAGSIIGERPDSGKNVDILDPEGYSGDVTPEGALERLLKHRTIDQVASGLNRRYGNPQTSQESLDNLAILKDGLHKLNRPSQRSSGK